MDSSWILCSPSLSHLWVQGSVILIKALSSIHNDISCHCSWFPWLSQKIGSCVLAIRPQPKNPLWWTNDWATENVIPIFFHFRVTLHQFFFAPPMRVITWLGHWISPLCLNSLLEISWCSFYFQSVTLMFLRKRDFKLVISIMIFEVDVIQ